MVVIGGPQTRCSLTIVPVQVNRQARIFTYYLRVCRYYARAWRLCVHTVVVRDAKMEIPACNSKPIVQCVFRVYDSLCQVGS